MTRNNIFAEAVYDILCQYGPLRTADIYPLVEARVPDWCIEDWKKGVQGAQQSLKDRGLIAYERLSGSLYLWKVVQ